MRTPIADVKAVLMLLIVIVIGIMWWRINAKLEDYDSMKADNATMKAQIGQIQERQADYDAALLDKAEREAWANTIRVQIDHSLTQAKRNDPQAAAYLDTPIPDSVRNAWRSTAKPPADAGATRPDRNQ